MMITLIITDNHDALTQCCFNAGPASATLVQHSNNIGCVAGTAPGTGDTEVPATVYSQQIHDYQSLYDYTPGDGNKYTMTSEV